jgi:hypothetical protein
MARQPIQAGTGRRLTMRTLSPSQAQSIDSSDSLPRDSAMRVSIRWFPVVGLLSLLGTGVVAPALARDGIATSGMAGFPSSFAIHTARPFMRNSNVMSHIGARNLDVQNDLRFRRHSQSQNGQPITLWPYSSFTDTLPMDVSPGQSEFPSSPSVIVMSGLPNGVPDRAIPETPPDYGYIAGCRAIPNGYHCDTPHNGTAASSGG